MKKILAILSVAILLLPTFSSADCVDLGESASWILETFHTVTFYEGQKPIARIEVPNCEIYPFSTIQLLNRDLCDMDQIMVDGMACNVISVQILH